MEHGEIATAFGRLLNQAIFDKKIALARIVELLEERGRTCTPATLSYWQSGKSLPRRASSARLLPDLEEILELEAGSLSEALARDLGTHDSGQGARSAPETSAQTNPFFDIETDTKPGLRVSSQEMSFEREAERIALIDHITISPDYCTATERITIVARPHRLGGGTLHFGFHLIPGSKFAEEGIDAMELYGARVSQVVMADESSIVVAAELPESTSPDMLHQISYVNREVSSTPFTETNERMFPWPLRHFSCQVAFEGELPDSIEWVRAGVEELEHGTRKVATISPLELYGNTVQVSMEDVSTGSTYITWRLP